MESNEILRKLNSVGKAIFVIYYDLFESVSTGRISRDECVHKLVADGVSNINGAKIRCGNAKLIFDNGKQIEALEMVLASSRLSAEVVKEANVLMRDQK